MCSLDSPKAASVPKKVEIIVAKNALIYITFNSMTSTSSTSIHSPMIQGYILLSLFSIKLNRPLWFTILLSKNPLRQPVCNVAQSTFSIEMYWLTSILQEAYNGTQAV